MTFWQWFTVLFSWFFGILFIIGAFESKQKFGAILLIHVSLSLIFGSIYYYLYSTGPESFIVDAKVFDKATIEATTEQSTQYRIAIDEIQFTDAVMLDLLENEASLKEILPMKLDQPIKVSQMFSIECREQAVIGSVPEASTQYVVLKAVRNNLVDSLGIRSLDYMLFEGTFDELDISYPLIIAAVQINRDQQVSALRNNYTKGTISIKPFNVIDFYYFSFTIIGASELTAGSTKLRVIVMLQILCLLGMIALIDSRENPNVK